MNYKLICIVLPPSVATGFPAGQTPLETRLQEVRLAVADGATEIDIVINRTLALTGQWEGIQCSFTLSYLDSVQTKHPLRKKNLPS